MSDFKLSASTLAALQDFLKEKDEKAAAELQEASDVSASLATGEDWELSQFWYDEKTSVDLAMELVTLGKERYDGSRDVRIACLSCPSIYKAFRALVAAGKVPDYVKAVLFEFDPRFGVFGDEFVLYDFNHPLKYPKELTKAVDILALDPPFLNPGCLTSFALTVRMLRRTEDAPIMLCTGAIMLRYARKLMDLRPTKQHVGHAKALSNPFACFVNYDPTRLGGWDTDAEAADARAAAAEAAEAATAAPAAVEAAPAVGGAGAPASAAVAKA